MHTNDVDFIELPRKCLEELKILRNYNINILVCYLPLCMLLVNYRSTYAKKWCYYNSLHLNLLLNIPMFEEYLH